MVYLGLLDRSPLFTNLRFMLHACICVYACLYMYVYVQYMYMCVNMLSSFFFSIVYMNDLNCLLPNI